MRLLLESTVAQRVWVSQQALITDGTTPGGRRYRCKEIGSYAKAQELLRQGRTYLDSNSDGEACESLR